MGRLRNLLAKWMNISPAARTNISPICTHPNLPEKQHYTKLVVNALDHCRTCSTNICLVCSEVHIQQHCTLDLKVNRELGEGNLLALNQGYLMELPLNNLRCTCGQPLGHGEDHAICSACGMASCSVECHKQWELAGNCTYSANYFQKPDNINMRSILFSNIRNIQKARISEWNLASKNALSYLACYAKMGTNHVYLQRGYRNYGVPQPELIAALHKVNKGLDFITHIERLCTCQCEVCIDRGHHSVGNCEFSCLNIQDLSSIRFSDNADLYFECSCDCSLCRSGIVVNRHVKMDCLLHCYKSDYNVNRLK